MAKSKGYIDKELEWLEDQWKSLQKYVDDNPISDMRDRVIRIGTGRGEKDQVTATIEAQIKSVHSVLAGLPDLLAAIEKLREKNQPIDIQIKGKEEMPWIMRDKFKG